MEGQSMLLAAALFLDELIDALAELVDVGPLCLEPFLQR